MGDKKCPKCKNEMIEKGTITCSNCKYKNWECEVCNHTESECLGIINYGV